MLITYLAAALTFVGLAILLVSLHPIGRICKEANTALGAWEAVRLLVVFFVAGYGVFGVRLLAAPADYIELTGAAVFFGGSLFVLIVTRLSLRTIREVRRMTALETENVLMRTQSQRLQAILDNTAQGIIVFDEHGAIDTFNHAAEQLFGVRESEILGWSVTRLIPPPDEESAGGVEYLHHARGELIARDAVGRQFPVAFSTTPMEVEGRRLYTCLVDDISERKAMVDQLRELAEHDSLTGLYNRHYFMQELERTVDRAKRGSAQSAVLLFIDLDNFKAVNDTYGHNAGDELLSEIADRLRRRTRDSDLLARLGGDEFAVLAYDVMPGDAVRLAEEYRALLDHYRVGDAGIDIALECSVGVAFVREDITDKEAVLSDADLACQLAKREGRNRVHVSRPEDRDQMDLWQ